MMPAVPLLLWTPSHPACCPQNATTLHYTWNRNINGQVGAADVMMSHAL